MLERDEAAEGRSKDQICVETSIPMNKPGDTLSDVNVEKQEKATSQTPPTVPMST